MASQGLLSCRKEAQGEKKKQARRDSPACAVSNGFPI
jgi:hypothetical protein